MPEIACLYEYAHLCVSGCVCVNSRQQCPVFEPFSFFCQVSHAVSGGGEEQKEPCTAMMRPGLRPALSL